MEVSGGVDSFHDTGSLLKNKIGSEMVSCWRS